MKAKKRIAFFVAALAMTAAIAVSSVAFTGCGEPTIVLNGSTSMEKVITAHAEAYMEDHDVRITYAATGSGAGVTAAQNGTADIGLASRDLTEEEEATGLVGEAIAVDAVAIIVAEENTTTTNVTAAQLKDIYFNGNENAIEGIESAAGREAGSGTRECFDDKVGIDKEDKYNAETVAEFGSNGEVAASVDTDVNHTKIGYVSLSSVIEGTKAIQFEGVLPSTETIADNTYKLWRNFTLVMNGGVEKLSEAAKGFYDFISTDEGQKIIEEAGAIPMSEFEK